MRKLSLIVVWIVLFSIGWFTLAQSSIITNILDKIEQNTTNQSYCDQRQFRVDLETKFTAIQFDDQRQAIVDELLLWIANKKQKIGFLKQAGDIDPTAFICAVNILRAEYNISPLQYHPTLNSLARVYVQYLYTSKDFAHTTQSGIWLKQRFDTTTYEYDLAWENLARWYTNIHNVIDARMASTGHRQNLLDPRYQDMWIAYIWWYRVHLFATPSTGNIIE